MTNQLIMTATERDLLLKAFYENPGLREETITLNEQCLNMLQSLPVVDSEPVAWTWYTMGSGGMSGYLRAHFQTNKPEKTAPMFDLTPLYTSPQALAPITADDVTDEMVDAYLTSGVADWRDFTPELQLAARQVVARIVTAYISIRS